MTSIPRNSLVHLRSLAERKQIVNRLTLLSRVVFSQQTIAFSSTTKVTINGDAEGYSTSDESDVETLTEELKNVSRLLPKSYKQYHGIPPDMPYKDLLHRQQRYAAYGSASGEDPRIMWPTRDAILALEEEEKDESSQTLMERLARIEAEKKTVEEEKVERRKRIEKNMDQMPKWITEYRHKQVQAQKEAKEREIKKEALLEEARDYFGYKIQANDPKFQQMVEEKEEKEKAEAKKRKKEEKAKKLAARMAEEMAKVAKSESKTSS